ncbi:MAG: glycosyltransferase [Fusobacterium sp.]|uniref:glycosyltransferase n=1 Tax=Fusobacterium sp. TaxID=68766 RepID=UPI002A76184B|nr:glycosyltransferase [Fusobacterium sp.]MDY2981632.1 glycosyltransferase [Fusobacterium sp.]
MKKIIYFFLERKIIKESNILTYTNKYLKEIYQKKFPSFSNKMTVLVNPIEVTEIENELINQKKLPLEKIRFCYTGTLTRERNLDPVLEYLKKNNIKKFELFIIGGFGTLSYSAILGLKLSSFIIKCKRKRIEKKIRSYGYEESIKFLPFMSRKDLAKYIKEEIDVLINIDANLGDKNIFLSSKVIDYISYRKPILNFSNKGASTDFLKDFGINYYISYNEENKEPKEYSQLIPDLKQIKQYENTEIIKSLLKIGE